jgi:hypothetical protein
MSPIPINFGLCNSPATFSRLIQLVLKGLTWIECLAYLDDVIVLGKNCDDHLNNLTTVLERFKKYNLKLKLKKCNLFQNEIKFLGKIISADGIKINPENVVTVKTRKMFLLYHGGHFFCWRKPMYTDKTTEPVANH